MANHTITLDPVEIDAPADVVWEILADIERYPEWNPFTPQIDSTLEIGEPVTLHIKRGDDTSPMTFVLEVLDPPREIAWRLPKKLLSPLFSAYRTQRVEALGDARCSYTTSDTFSGLIAGPLYRNQSGWVHRNFEKLAAALKERAEAAHNIQQSS